MMHYTNNAGYKSISSQHDWAFKASKPPGIHEKGAYFTTLGPATKNLCARLRIPQSKVEYIFDFSGDGGLESLAGGRGNYVFFTRNDYVVKGKSESDKSDRGRQGYHGKSEEMK